MRALLRRWLGLDKLEARVELALERTGEVITRAETRLYDGIDGRLARLGDMDAQYSRDQTYNAALTGALMRTNATCDNAHRVAMAAVKRRFDPQGNEP